MHANRFTHLYCDVFWVVRHFIYIFETSHVSATLEDDADKDNKISMVILYTMQWISWCETRWCGIGPCGRKWAVSTLVGIDSIVELALQDPEAFNYGIPGYKKFCHTDVRLYLLVACLSAWAVEGCCESLMKDDRLLLFNSSLQQEIKSEIILLEGLSLDVWNALATIAMDTDTAGWQLRDLCLNSAHVGYAFAHRNGFCEADVLPLSLTQGDIESNIQRFIASPLPHGSDDATGRIYDSALLSAPNTVRGLRLLRDSPRSSQLCEKSHVQGKFLKMYHNRLHALTLQLRSAVCDCRTFFRPSKAEKVLACAHQKYLKQMNTGP